VVLFFWSFFNFFAILINMELLNTIYINNYPLGNVIISFITNWYWVILPFIFWPLFKKTWLWWRRELWEKRQKYMLLELKFPTENEKPFISMEHILDNIWSIYSNIHGWNNWQKKWWLGRKLQYFCFEIVGSGDGGHKFYVRVLRNHIDALEIAFHSQYPQMEITQVREDYAENISWNVPDKKWNFYGLDFVLSQNDIYPIKTYSQFFELKPENTKEEKRVDPINSLIESINHLHKEEQLWIQMKIVPITKKDNDYMKRGRKLINKLVNREEKIRLGLISTMIKMFIDIFKPSSNNPEIKDKKQELIPPEMKLTPREREIVESVEKKLSKNMFEVSIRGLYIAPNKIYNPTRKSLMEEYFASFNLPDQNMFKKFSPTKTKIRHFFVKHRTYLRKRKMFKRYIMRDTPLYPKKGGTFILNTEELATMFHPPVELRETGGQSIATKIKKGSAPTNLPT